MSMNIGLSRRVKLSMQQVIKYFWVSLILVSCGTSEDSRYRDNALLERPPTLVIHKPSEGSYETDDSSIPKKQDPGLGEDVYMTSSTPPQLKIKKSFDKSWNILIQAIKLKEIKITDQERNKGHLYVAYDSSGFLEKVTSFMKDGQKSPVYLLNVEENGAETTITASIANKTEQNSASSNPDGYNDKPVEDSDELLETLYKTLHDDLVEE